MYNDKLLLELESLKKQVDLLILLYLQQHKSSSTVFHYYFGFRFTTAYN